jgi:hypothetical protein
VNIDAHSRVSGTSTAPTKKRCSDPDAAWFQKGDDDPHRGWKYLITLTMPAHNLYGEEVGHLITGMSIGKGSGGNAREAVAAVDAHIASGYGPRVVGRRTSSANAIADMGYTNLYGLAAELHKRHYWVVQEYPVNAPTRRGLRHTCQEGQFIFGGKPLCPGASTLVAPPLHLPEQSASGDELIVHDRRVQQLKAHTMRIHGHPEQIDENRRHGSAPKDDQKHRDVYRVRTACPAREKKPRLRCPHVMASLAHPPGSIPDVASPPPKDDLPEACHSALSMFVADDRLLKDLNRLMHGTWEHHDRHNGARSRNEAGNSKIKSPNAGALTLGKFQLHGIANVGSIAAFTIVALNLSNADAHQRAIDRNGGRAPIEDRVEQQRGRHERMKEALERDRM